MIGKFSYIYDEIRENYDDGFWWRHRIANHVLGPIHTNLYPTKRESIRLVEEDWDNLIVLDGCRADLFEEVAELSRFDEYNRVTSLGSKTPEWARENFTGRELGDTVYLSSNGWVSQVVDDTFHEMVEVWDEVDNVVTPEEMTTRALDAADRHPDKRLLVHYLQPHRPFLGANSPFDAATKQNPWKALSRGEVTRAEIWSLYADNLRIVLEELETLLNHIPGRTVVTSDHGNALGERAPVLPMRVYGHPGGVRMPSLVDVPWAVVEGDERKSIIDEGVTSVDRPEEASVRDNLDALGYRG